MNAVRRNRPAPNRLREPAPAKPSPRARRPLGSRLAAWREQRRFGFATSLARLAARPLATALTVLVIGIALALPLLFHVVLDNARGLSSGMREAREITVFLKPAESADSARGFAEALRGRADVAGVVVRTPDEGLEEFRTLSGFADALDVLQHNPLPSVIVVTPAAGGADEAALADAVAGDARTDMVQYDAAWRKRLGAILALGERAVAALMILLSLGTLLVIGNTVRTDIQSRAEEIAVMQLIGASDGFVRRPFVYTGLWYGALGGLLAVVVVYAMQLAVSGPADGLLASYGGRFTWHGLGIGTAASLVAISIVLGALGAWIAATRHLLAGRPGE